MGVPKHDELTLTVNGTVYGGWTDIRLSRGVERFPSDFEISVTDKYNGAAMAIEPGQPVEVRIGADRVLVGYVDRVGNRVGPSDHTIAVSGRSKCQDLIDCSAEVAEWGGQRLEAEFLPLVEELAAPYGIAVSDRSGGGANEKFEAFTVNLGESGYEIIERVARSMALLVYDDTAGNLVLARVGEKDGSPARDGLKLGQNVQAAAVQWAMDARYRKYVVVPQAIDSQRDMREAAKSTERFEVGEELDPGVTRNRTLILVGEQFQRGESLGPKRALWEKNRRWGRSQVLKATTDSWRDAKGRLWEPNTLVNLDLPQLRLSKRAWLLADVTYRRSAQSGTVADLTLMPQEAFSIQPTTLAPMDWDSARLVQETRRVAGLPAGQQDPQQ